jgi:hypothetical protein
MFRPNFYVRSLKTIRFFCIFTFLAISIAFTFELTNVKSESFDNEANQLADSTVPAAELTHNLVASFYDLENYPTARLLLNNKGLSPIELRPTLYSLDGSAFEPAPVTVEPNSFRFVSINDLASAGGENFRKGSIKLFHTGKDLIIGSQVYLEKESQSLSFEERFGELGKFDSRRLEAIWYMPRAQTGATIILSNTSDEAISVSARLNRKGETQTFPLAPHQTRVLDLRQDFADGQRIGSAQVVGIALEHNGGKSALKAHGQIKDAPIGYSNIVTFSNPNTGKSSELHGFGLHLGAMDGENLEPVVAVKNVGGSLANVTVKVPYTRVDDTTGALNLAPITIKSGEMRLLDMSALIQRSRDEQIKIAGIEITSDAAPGSILASVQSVSADKRQVFRVPLYDPYAQTSSTGGYPWRIDETSRTVFYIKNTTDFEKEYIAYLVWSGGQYMLGIKKIAPRQTIEIDMKKLRDEQTPDERGNTIPLNVSVGQIKWTTRFEEYSSRAEELKRFDMIGRSEQIDTVKGVSSSYACQNCCQKNAWALVYGEASNADVGDFVQFYAREYGSDCYGNPYDVQMANSTVNWDTSDSDIATVDGYGLAHVVGAGSVNVKAQWYGTKTNNYGGWCPNPPYLTGETEEVEKVETEKAETEKADTDERPDCNGACSTISFSINDSEPLTTAPKVTNVTATPAEVVKISQVTGNQNFYHFVTPKDTANPQITLTATLNANNGNVGSQISWEGATESPTNPLQATLSRSSSGKTIVKIKYGTKVLKEMRLWVIWSTITTTDVASHGYGGYTGRPAGPAFALEGGYNFTHTIDPVTIFTDADRPNLTGANTTPPPGGNHPINGGALSGGADRKWDNSRQIRFKILRPTGLSHLDTGLYLYGFPSDSTNYPADPEGNDDTTTSDPETNDPYANPGVLTGYDLPVAAICHRAGVDGDTYEQRLQFREFTRVELEGTWYRISDYYPWKAHLRFIRVNGAWTNDNSVKLPDNSGF